VIDEAVHAIQRTLASSTRVGKSKSDAVLEEALEMMLALPDLTIVQPPTSVAKNAKLIELMKKYSLRARDAFHLLTMQEHHISYCATFDADFDRVFDTRLLRKLIRD
jgi:predicted nucleic acid-binding protein